MEKRLRSSLQTSAEDFLKSATKLDVKSARSSLKSLIHGLNPSPELAISLPLALQLSISQFVARFKRFSVPTTTDAGNSPQSPPTKRLRRSSRNSKTKIVSNEDDPNARCENAKQGAVDCLQICACVAQLCVSHPTRAFSASDLLPAVCELHDNLILFEDKSGLCSEIAHLCEQWWKEELPGREALISQSLPFMVSRSLTLNKKVDVHRVYALREAFALFDFDDESIEDLKLLLIRCVIAPLYLKAEDGRRFMAFMLGLSRHLVKEVLEMIKSQIPFGRKSMLEAYADIVFRAWKVVEGPSKDEIERFLQSLIESSIHASSGSLAASIRRVLGGFICQRTTGGVENLLFRLAEPVIFRSLQVSNSNVRQNALHLLLDLFPLEDPDATKEVNDAFLDKQFFLLERLLVDECPDIRVVAVEGSCRILNLFWEIIPSSTITKVITKIFDDMVHDSSTEVRLSSVNGITYMHGNPQSHAILKVLLPRLAHLTMDSTLSVRNAVVDLLLVIRDCRNFQFHKVVQLDVLLSMLANDQPLVAQKITKLLIPSYFPSKIPLEESCSRCVTLIKRSPLAGARFCEFSLSEGASMHALMELCKVIIRLVLSRDKLDANQIDGLLTAAAHLCNNLVSEAPYKAALEKELPGEKLKGLFYVAATPRAQSSVCKIASNICRDAVDGLFSEFMGLVTSCSDLPDNAQRQSEVRCAHKMMFSCNRFDNMFEAITRLLENAVHKCQVKFGVHATKHEPPPLNKRKLKSSIKLSAKLKHTIGKNSSVSVKSRLHDDYVVAVGISWQIKDLLISENTRKAMLGSGILEMTFSALRALSEISIARGVQFEFMDTLPVLAYTALALHIHFQNVSIDRANTHGTIKKDFLDFTTSCSEGSLLDQTIDHLLNCTSKLYKAYASESAKLGKLLSESRHSSSGKKRQESQTGFSRPGEAGSIFTRQKKISNMVKMQTAVLKFIVDARTMDLVPQNLGRCLKFTVEYVKFITTNIKQLSHDQLQFKVEDFRETFLCLKSSVTYAAKLLNVVLDRSCEASPPTQEACILVNHLFDLIISVEEYLGSGYAARLVSAIRSWLPDLILTLGSWNLCKPMHEEMTWSLPPNHSKSNFPLWPLVLAKIELCELSDITVSKPEEFSAFMKLMEMFVQLLRGNWKVLDAVGLILLSFSRAGLEKKSFDLVLGLLHFVCNKLVVNEDNDWGELNLMLRGLAEIFPLLRNEADELRSNDEGKQKLRIAIALLEPIWTRYIHMKQGDCVDQV